MQIIDLLVIVVYLVATAWLGLKLSGRQTGLKDYFLGGRNLPWWAVCLSVVATAASSPQRRLLHRSGEVERDVCE